MIDMAAIVNNYRHFCFVESGGRHAKSEIGQNVGTQQTRADRRSMGMFRRTLATVALVSIASSAHPQTMSSRAPAEGPMVTVSAPETFQSAAIAKAAIEARGYEHVRNLQRDPVGNWSAEAVRGGIEIAVILQPDGDIAEE